MSPQRQRGRVQGVPARFKGCGGQGGEGGNRNPPKLPLPAEHVFASSADDALLIGDSYLLLMLLGRTRSARPRGLGGDFDFSPLNPLGTP